MSLTKEQVNHLSKLARIELSEEETRTFSSQISAVLDYIEILNELDTENILPTHQVTGLANISRKDKILNWISGEELLKCSKLPIYKKQIKVKKVL